MASRICPSCAAKGLKADFVFCPYCSKELPSSGCPNCGNKDTGSSKFCPECGAKLGNVGSKPAFQSAADVPIAESGITLEFGYSSSQNFDTAVEAAKRIPSFQEFGAGKKATYRIWVEASELASCLELYTYIRGWKSSRIFIDGKKTTFDATFGFSWCYERRQASFKPDLYCYGFENDRDLNLWGCVEARMSFSDYEDWWQWGRWNNKKGDWQFDKERIGHGLQTQLYSHRYCPALQPSLIGEVLSALPDVVNPNRDKNWKFIRAWSDEDVPGGLVVKVKEHGYEETVVYTGVCPKGANALKDIMKRLKHHRIPAEIIR